MRRYRLVLVMLALFTLGISGCVHESTDGNRHIFTYEWWLPALVLLGGIGAVPIGLAMRRSIPRLGWGLVILAPIAAIGGAPSLFMEKSVVDDKSFSVQSGIWGMTAVHSVNFDDLSQVRLVVEKSIGRRGRRQSKFFLVCDRKGSGSEKIAVGNDVQQAAAAVFLQQVVQRQISVVDQTGQQ